jgi:hypothetical protein
MPTGHAMLVVGHPGHELRVHGWMEAAQPIVMVLTDGSGHTGQSRLQSTEELVARAGARPGSIFGRATDAGVYRALLTGDISYFKSIVDDLARALVVSKIAVVVGDDAEGYNPTHDICRLVVNAAVDRARALSPSPIANLAFMLADRPDRADDPDGAPSSRIRLDAAALIRKLAAAERYVEMATEVRAARQAWGDEAFAVERFRWVPAGDLWQPGPEPPFYEQFGAKRVQEGTYADVIRYDAHVRPLAEALAGREPVRTRLSA